MELSRKAFQGVCNIVHFNWHFYIIAGVVLFLLYILSNELPIPLSSILSIGVGVTIFSILLSLFISYLIYDVSDLYKLNWLGQIENKTILNVNAGFDETSEILRSKYPNSELIICDFFNPEKHTEVSIKRARKAYPPVKNTIQISTEKIPLDDNYFDFTLAILTAHEIRNEDERIGFFKELNRVTKSSGKIFVTEHLRDINNFIVYTIGSFHFHSKSSWLQTFKLSNLSVIREIKTSPFITTFILERNGDSY